MTFGSPPDPSDSAHSLGSGLFNAAGVQVTGMLGSSFVSDVIRVERTGVNSAVKILTPGAASDPDIVSRFLINARYNQSLGEFTGVPITEVVENGPRPYLVMNRVAQSSLQEVIRQHAPIDARWLATLLQPIARSLDTIHQRGVLHANVKPSNILIVVENNQERFLLVDYLDPSLAATSATMMGAGVYAAPEFRSGSPVSNRSDIYSLSAVMYEALSGIVPGSAYRGADGEFHVMRSGERPRELCLLNPKISRTSSDIIMNGLAPDAISRPATATAMVEEILRTVEAPRAAPVPVAEPEPEHHPVPMLLIVAAVFLSILLLFGAFKFVSGLFGGSDSPATTASTSSSSSTSLETRPQQTTENEQALAALMPADHQCTINQTTGSEKKWSLSLAMTDCTTVGVGELSYGLFDSGTSLDNTYKGQALTFADAVAESGGSIKETLNGIDPCSASPNESGEWGPDPSSPASASGAHSGKYTCVSVPYPRIIWTDRNANVIGDASLQNGSMADLITWWKTKSGPK